MDPLSVTCGILTIAGAVLGSLKILQTVLGASDEAVTLINEVTDLQVVLKDVQSILKESPTVSTESLRNSLSKLNRCVHLLHDFVHTRLLKEEDLDNIRISKLVWLYEWSHILRYQRELKMLRSELNTALSLANLSSSSRVELSVANIIAVGNETKAFLAEQGVYNQSLAEEIRDLKHLWLIDPRRLRLKKADGAKTPDSFLDGTRTPAEDHEKRGPEVQLLWQPPFKCSSECFCDCHQATQTRSPPILDKFLGALFIGYTSLPLLRPSCNVIGCLRQKFQGLKLTWYFPNWFIKRMIAFTYMSKPGNGLQVSLKVTKIVDNGSQIFSFTQVGDLDGIQALFQKKLASPLDVGHLDGCCPLYFAVLRGQLHLVDFFLKWGADKDLAANTFRTPRSLAWTHILEGIMKKETIEYYREVFPMGDMEEFGFTLLHEILAGIKHGSLQKAIQKMPSAIDKCDNEQRTPLMWASVRGNQPAIETLLRHGASVQAQQTSGETALHYAALGVNLGCVRALVRAGAKLQRGLYGMDSIHKLYSRNDDLNVLAALLELPVDINSKDLFDHSYLGTAAWRNHHKVLSHILQRGADYEALDLFGATPLLRAVRYGAVEAAEALIKFGANTLAKDRNGQTILHRAVLSRNQQMLEFLSDIATQYLFSVAVEAKDIADMTARDRLHELEPPAGLLAAFTKLTSTTQQANADRKLATALENKLMLEKREKSEDGDTEEFFDTFESVDLLAAGSSTSSVTQLLAS